MIRLALHRSILLGLDGALGLHSLAQAAGFYEKLGFVDGGADAAEAGLHYMERRQV
jgi:hypothetical protein